MSQERNHDEKRGKPVLPHIPIPMKSDDIICGLPLKLILFGFQSSSSNLDACWQRDFERRYIELEELGRGRFSVVRRCQEILSGDEVAVKFINRRKQIREETQKEFEILSILNHPNIVSATGLFLTATSDAIVMKL